MSNEPPHTEPGRSSALKQQDHATPDRGLPTMVAASLFIYLAILVTAAVLTRLHPPGKTTSTTVSKVGPNYQAAGPSTKAWIDADDKRVRTQSDDLSKWWTVFNDPVLDSRLATPTSRT